MRNYYLSVKAIVTMVFAIAFFNLSFAQTLLLQESFEGDASNYDANTFTDDVSDYFLVHSNDASLPSGWLSTLTNVDGTHFFAAEDVDAPENTVATEGYIIFSSQDITAYDQVQVTLSAAIGTLTSFESAEPDGIKVQYAFDTNIATAGDANVNTGTYTSVGAFAANKILSSSLTEDKDMDGKGDGIALSRTFQDFTFAFPTNGASNVSVRIVVDCDGSEEVAVDNIRIYGVNAPTTQALEVAYASTTAYETTISWSRGNGSNCAVFIKEASTGTAAPVHNTTYTANTTFGSGTQIATSGWYCVYNGSGTSVSLNGLSSATDYRVHVCEYNGIEGSELYLTDAATNNPGNRTTLEAATVTTEEVTDITTTTATGNGNITSLGYAHLTQYGVCWNTSGAPTTSDNKTEEGPKTAAGVFTSDIAGLTENTTYYVRAYATNAAGTSYGAEVSFKTQLTTGIKVAEKSKITVSPNPTRDIVSVANAKSQSEFSLYNATGAMVKSGVLNSNIIDISELKAGIYILVIEGEKIRIVKK